MKPFHFKQFSIQQDRCAMKVTLDACAFGAWLPLASTYRRVLDIGTGTGLLALMAAQKTAAKVDAIEIDASAAQQAADNIAASPFSARIQVQQQDIKAMELAGQYDAVICNPPFFSDHLKGPDPLRNQARHNDGLSFEQLCFIIAQALSEKGNAYVLIPTTEQTRFVEAATTAALYVSECVNFRSRETKPPHRVFLALSKIPPHTQAQNMLTIYDADTYSAEFVALMHPYYLNL